MWRLNTRQARKPPSICFQDCIQPLGFRSPEWAFSSCGPRNVQGLPRFRIHMAQPASQEPFRCWPLSVHHKLRKGSFDRAATNLRGRLYRTSFARGQGHNRSRRRGWAASPRDGRREPEYAELRFPADLAPRLIDTRQCSERIPE